MILYLAVGVCSVIYLILSGYMDLKERMIYGMPALILTVGWGIFMWRSQMWNLSFLLFFWFVHIAMYVLFNYMHIWGAGDSDVFLLFANVSLIAAGRTTIYHIVLMECMGVILSMMMSIGIGVVEFKLKKQPLGLHGKVAVIPGFSIMISLLIMKGFTWRYM